MHRQLTTSTKIILYFLFSYRALCRGYRPPPLRSTTWGVLNLPPPVVSVVVGACWCFWVLVVGCRCVQRSGVEAFRYSGVQAFSLSTPCLSFAPKDTKKPQNAPFCKSSKVFSPYFRRKKKKKSDFLYNLNDWD